MLVPQSQHMYSCQDFGWLTETSCFFCTQDEGSFPLLVQDWGAIEEVLLLDAVEQDGFGNWQASCNMQKQACITCSIGRISLHMWKDSERYSITNAIYTHVHVHVCCYCTPILHCREQGALQRDLYSLGKVRMTPSDLCCNEQYTVDSLGCIPSNHHATVLEGSGGEGEWTKQVYYRASNSPLTSLSFHIVPPSPRNFTPVKLEHAEQLELGYMPLRDDFKKVRLIVPLKGNESERWWFVLLLLVTKQILLPFLGEMRRHW